MALRVVLFLVINFLALGVGGFFTGKGVPSEWYQQLNKAPWTRPGWVFGAAWTAIMVCLAFYMAMAWQKVENIKLFVALFSVQWVLNVVWNPIFFYYHNMLGGLIVIVALTLLVAFFFCYYFSSLKYISFFILPYLLWLLIATSLNAYAYWYN